MPEDIYLTKEQILTLARHAEEMEVGCQITGDAYADRLIGLNAVLKSDDGTRVIGYMTIDPDGTDHGWDI